METLKQKLERFNFPEPQIEAFKDDEIYYVDDEIYYVEWWNQKGSGCGKLAIMYRYEYGFTFCGWDTNIETDQDWQTIANFIRFLKGE
jgi:hypothetical protein